MARIVRNGPVARIRSRVRLRQETRADMIRAIAPAKGQSYAQPDGRLPLASDLCS